MKIGLAVKIDVTKINKNRLFKGEKGTYLDLTTFIDLENPSEYGDHGFIAQSVSKEERGQGIKGDILGNVKVFFTGDSEKVSPPSEQQMSDLKSAAAPQQSPQNNDFDDEIPFLSYEFRSII